MLEKHIEYNAGPTAQRFHADNTKIRGIRGAIRTGKSVICSTEGVGRAFNQVPCNDNVIRARFLVVRNTYGQLKDTTIKTFLTWFPPESCGDYKENPYPNYFMKLRNQNGVKVELDVWFRALDLPKHVRNLLSMEYTFWWANEARELRKDFIDWLDSRSGQYPPKIMKPANYDGLWPSWYGGWMDTNSPYEEHWWYVLFEEQCNLKHEKYDFELASKYKQFWVPKEENEHNLPANYYKELAVGKDSEWIKVYIDGQYGFAVEGKAVYPDYSDPYHCRKDNYEPMHGLKIYRGWDIGEGLFPAVVFAQTNHGIEIFDELLMENVSLPEFARHVMQYSNEFYPGFKFMDFADPAMFRRVAAPDTPRTKDLPTVKRIIEEKGFSLHPGAVSFDERKAAVTKLLRQVASPRESKDAEPFLRLSPRCHYLRLGFKGDYHFREINTQSGIKYSPEPNKTKLCCHLHDAFQYLATGLFSPYEEKVEDEHKKVYVPVRPPSAMAA